MRGHAWAQRKCDIACKWNRWRSIRGLDVSCRHVQSRATRPRRTHPAIGGARRGHALVAFVSCGARPAATPQSAAALDRQIRTVDSLRDGSGRQDGIRAGRRVSHHRKPPGRGSRGARFSRPGPMRTESPDDDSAVAPPMVFAWQARSRFGERRNEIAQVRMGVNAALARRIVADRRVHGKFGCLAELRTVQGMGPALMRRIDSLVTFSSVFRGRPAVTARGEPSHAEPPQRMGTTAVRQDSNS